MFFVTLLSALAMSPTPQVVGPLPKGKLNFPKVQSVSVPAPKAKATVLLFVGTECPIANRYAPEIARIEKEYRPRGVAMIRVYPDPAVTLPQIARHAEEFKLEMKAVRDGKRQWTKLVGATITPEAAVIGPDGTMLYRGRIDDRNVEHGRLLEEGFRKDLRIALDEILAGKPVSVKVTPAIGCFIADLQLFLTGSAKPRSRP